jgi:uncharacterized protein (DUF1501 family)
MKDSRREFIRKTCCTAGALGAATAFSRLGLINALAQSSPGFRALVCIFLFGGNDSNNLIVPLDSAAGTTNYTNYNNVRSPGGLAIPQTSLLSINAKTMQPNLGTTLFGLHPNATELQTLFNANALAFLANVGSLVAPTTQASYLAKTLPVPANLFSHADQQQQWQTSDPARFGAPAIFGTTGWAGRMADKIEATFNTASPFPPIISVAGSAIFCTGQQTQPYAIIPGTNFGSVATAGLSGFDSSAAASARLAALQQLLTFDTGISLIQPASSITSNSLADSKTLAGALASISPIATVFPGTPIGAQLLQVAKILKVRSALGLQRQVFFCSLGGFDTHSNQIALQGNLLSNLSPAMKAFYDATVELGIQQQVTTFTMSDFSRTFQPASGGGTDHAWGSVQMIAGGAVLGGDIYGKMPTFALSGPDDSTNKNGNGRWIPTTSIDQFGATLATWFGVQAADLPAIFPNLANFTTKNLGFLG